MRYGFVRTAALTPEVRVADCGFNARKIVDALRDAAKRGVEVACLPELCVTGYTCGDLFLQPTLWRAAHEALMVILLETSELPLLFSIGLPVVWQGKLYNCAVVCQRGYVLGVVPKTHLPNYGEFYERRHFAPAPEENGTITICGCTVPFGTRILFQWKEMPDVKVGVELCEDLWAPLPPSTHHALAGATLLCNLSASNETISKAEYRRALCTGQSARLLCGYVYADAGCGESTTDMVFAGHNLIAENGVLLSESAPFGTGLAIAEIDVERLMGERLKKTSFPAACADGYTVIHFSMPVSSAPLLRRISPSPFVPEDDAERAERCNAILTMQAAGLEKRLRHTNAHAAVVGISGGLDSCLALLVTVRAFERLARPLSDIVAVTMPCFGTTRRTRENAERLCAALGVTLRTVDITATVQSAFHDIGQSEDDHDVTYENTQARVRTLVLMDLANKTGGLVIGTGDLSELALGWATYNGDHMSMYGVNASVPKTLVRHIVATAADTAGPGDLQNVLRDILATPVSPELLPAAGGEISQQTEEIVGPYALHDFFLYYAIRWGFSPAKIFYLARAAFAGEYSDDTIHHWLTSFYRRFFSQQFKRSCLPDGPKVGSVTLSPRGDWRMPSDAIPSIWLANAGRCPDLPEALPLDSATL